MIRTCVIIALTAFLIAADDGPTDSKWLDSRLPAKMRSRMESLIGQPLPQPPEGMRWIGGEKPITSAGSILVIQSVGAGAGKAILEKTRKALPDEVVLIGVHGVKKADRIEKELAQRSPCPVAIDADGKWTAALNLPETPTNIVVDAAGKIRFIGIRTDALRQAVTALHERDAPAAKPPASTPAASAGFPSPSGKVKSATDRRGERMPDFEVDQWITTRPPPPERKLLVIDFWATWCGPCVAAIPHMNELATKFEDIAQCVGISDEQPASFQQGLARIGKDLSSFQYSLALAPNGKLKRFFGVTGIPHCVIVSSDGFVRWQGHPASLSEEMFRQFADAQRALNKTLPASTEHKTDGSSAPRKH